MGQLLRTKEDCSEELGFLAKVIIGCITSKGLLEKDPCSSASGPHSLEIMCISVMHRARFP